MNERYQAIELANKILDRPSADPDDDLAVLARQLVRTSEALTTTGLALVMARRRIVDDGECLRAIAKGLETPANAGRLNASRAEQEMIDTETFKIVDEAILATGVTP